MIFRRIFFFHYSNYIHKRNRKGMTDRKEHAQELICILAGALSAWLSLSDDDVPDIAVVVQDLERILPSGIGGISDIAGYLREDEVKKICASHRRDALQQLSLFHDPARLWRNAVHHIMAWNSMIYKDRKQSDQQSVPYWHEWHQGAQLRDWVEKPGETTTVLHHPLVLGGVTWRSPLGSPYNYEARHHAASPQRGRYFLPLPQFVFLDPVKYGLLPRTCEPEMQLKWSELENMRTTDIWLHLSMAQQHTPNSTKHIAAPNFDEHYARMAAAARLVTLMHTCPNLYTVLAQHVVALLWFFHPRTQEFAETEETEGTEQDMKRDRSSKPKKIVVRVTAAVRNYKIWSLFTGVTPMLQFNENFRIELALKWHNSINPEHSEKYKPYVTTLVRPYDSLLDRDRLGYEFESGGELNVFPGLTKIHYAL
jgi:hypothetical protein